MSTLNYVGALRKAVAWTGVIVIAGILASSAPAASFSALPAADGFVTDSDYDGNGDYVVDGQASVLVGFDAYVGPGEHRGVYEFDISAIPTGSPVLSATLGLNLTGSRLADPDPTLTLHASAGNGALDVADYGLASFVTTFTLGSSPSPYDTFENTLDVTAAVQAAANNHARYAAFAVWPNPLSRVVGAWLFSSTETGVFSTQFFPAELRVAYGPAPPDETPPELSLPPQVAVDATGPDGAAVDYSVSATDGAHPVPLTCSPAAGSTFAIGDTTVSCAAIDAAGNEASGSFVVHVAGSKEQLDALLDDIVSATDLPVSTRAGLAARLQALLANFDPDDPRDRLVACVGLSVVVNRIEWSFSLGIAPDRAAGILADATRIRSVLACA